tara:strand:- start:22998 stop:25019 length:2022 start_codon:yes stop_codon:yes gene_type:complete
MLMQSKSIATLLATAALATKPGLALSQNNTQLEEVRVFGRGTDLVGAAASASQGSVAGSDLLVRPMLKVAELLESMPGMVAVQHSGSGKANQYFLRGFNLDHGTDYTTYVDGTPWNLRSHGHGQGYLDVNGLIPETVERISFRKGPYYADLGDFSLAGASSINTIDRLDENFISAEIGDYGWQRFVGGASFDLSGGMLTLVGESKTYDGPWALEEGLEHFSFWSKYLLDTSFGRMAFSLSGYSSDWHPTEQIPERVINSTICEDEFCSLDDSASGSTNRLIATFAVTGNDWDASVYGQYYDWSMDSNPTYDAQIHQFDERITFGALGEKALLDSSTFELNLGAEARHDDIRPVGVSDYNEGEFVAENGDNNIIETSLGAYTELIWHASSNVRLMAGMRADYFDFHVTANNVYSIKGDASESQIFPKFGAAYTVNNIAEFYGNWGKGFHSNDARGVVNPNSAVPGLSEGTGYEFGSRFTLGDFKVTSAYWWLDQDSELIFVGDSNSVEPKGGSKREGYELTMFWQPLDWMGIDAVYTDSKARYTDPADGIYIEQAIEKAAQLGIAATFERWEASARLRYLGPYAMTADNSERAGDLTTLSLRGAYHWTSLTLYAEVINAFNEKGKDISYYYEAYIEGFDPPGLTSEEIDCGETNCTMSRVTEPRSFRIGLRFNF